MGPEPFRDGLREYLKAHAFGNATWSDLIAVLGRHTHADLVSWSRAWVEERGRPRIAMSRSTVGGTTTVTLEARPMISGAYMASPKGPPALKVPAVVARTRYVNSWRPAASRVANASTWSSCFST